MRRFALLLMASLWTACGQLPSLPSAAVERVAAELEFNGLSLAVGFEGAGTTVQPDAILAGTAVEAMFTVRAQDGLPLAGALIQFGVKTERWERVLDFPLGTSCTTDAQGECSTVLRSEGRAGAVQFEARVAGLESQWINLTVLPADGQAQVLVEIEGLGSFDWETGQEIDPLDNESTRLVMDRNQAEGTALQVRLLDTYGNPLVGLPVNLAVVVEQEQEGLADAGPRDVSVPDFGGIDAALPVDSGVPDVGFVRDVHGAFAGDTGVATDAAASVDGGRNKVLSLSAEDSPVLLALATGDGCPRGLAASSEISANVGVDGYARFCVLPGEELGDFKITIQPAELFEVGGSDSMILSGETRAGAPSRVVYVPSHEVAEGEELRLGCRPGSLSAVASFRVENEQGVVPNVRVKFAAEGGLDGLTSALEISDGQGLVEVQAICPARSLAGGRILADLAAVPGDQPASVAVQVRTDNVDEVTIVEHGAWPLTLRSGGDPLTLRVQAFNASGAPVLRAGLRPDDNAPDNREPLSFAVTIASQGHAGRILLDDGNGAFTVPLVEQTLMVDQDLGAADFRFKVQSPATFDNPIVLRVIEPGSQVSAQRVLHVAPGAPTHISVSPTGTVNAELLGAAGSFAFSVWDGDPAQGANRVPDVPISVAVPRGFVFLRGSNLTNIAGRTGNDGRFVVDVLQAQPIGDHTLEGSITVGEAQPSAPVTVRVGAGEVASALEVRLDGEALPVITPEGGEALPTLTMRGGTSLAQTLTFRIVNRFGGGMPGLGLTYSLEQGVEANCASFDEPSPTNTDGEITYGPGNQTLTAGGEVTDCVYRFAHGNTAAVQRLRVRQVPGLPQRATLTLTLRDGENDASAVRLRNSMDPPNEWSDETSREVVLRAFDANNLAPAGLRMWLTVDNCYLQTRAAELDEQGRAVFRVAGGPDAEAPCVLGARYFNERNDYTPPTLSVQGSGFVAPQLSAVHFDGSGSSFKLSRPFSTEYTWRLEGTGLRGPAGWLNGQCPEAGQCTYGQIVEMSQTWNEQGERSVLRVLTDEIPLRTTIQNGERSYTVRVRQSMMGPGRWLGFRIKDPGGEQQGQQLESVSRAVEFAAIPPVDWVSNSPGGTPGRVTVNGQGVSIRGGHRLNLDGDEADEFVLCGHAAGGRNFFAVVDRSEQGALPEAVDAVLSVEGEGDAQTHPQNACRIADLDGDGRLDLVLPGPKRLPDAQAGFLGFTVHRGVQGGFFNSEGQHLVWQIPALVNQDSVHFVLKTGPASIVACVATNCASPKELFINWNAQTERFAAGAMAAHDPLSGELNTGLAPVSVDRFRVAHDLSVEQLGLPRRQTHDDRMIYDRSADGTKLLYARNGDDPKLFVHRAADDALLYTLEWPQHPDNEPFQRVKFSPDGERVAAATLRTYVITYRLTNMPPGSVLEPENWAHPISFNDRLTAAELAFRPDGNALAIGRPDDRVRVFSLDDGRHLYDLAGDRIGWSHDSSKALTIMESTRVMNAYDLSQGQPSVHFTRTVEVVGPQRVTQIAPDPRWMIGFANWNDARYLTINWDNEIAYHSAPMHRLYGTIEHSELELGAFFGANENGHTAILSMHREVPGRSIYREELPRGNYARVIVDNPPRLLVMEQREGRTSAINLNDLLVGTLLPKMEHSALGSGSLLPGHSGELVDIAYYSGDAVYLRRPITWRAGCGNGVVEPGEAFDNGQPSEVTEHAYTCGAVCGDGVVQSGEDCDDGNDSNADACPTTCQAHRCGDGIIRGDLALGEEAYEACDDGNNDQFDGCDSFCNRCGDGQLSRYESCDDGNDVAGDGCTECRRASCGNGQLDEGEQCDDGNQSNDDACSHTCIAMCDYIDFQNGAYARPNLTQPPGTRTIEMWVQNLSPGYEHYLSGHWMIFSATTNHVFARAFTGNQNNGSGQHFDLFAELPEQLNRTLPAHIAVTFNGSSLRMFVNGQQIGSGVTNQNGASETRNYAIGALIRGPDRQFALINNYRTSLRALRYSNGVRYTENFNPDVELNVEPDTVYLYRSDGLAETHITDLGPNNRHAILYGGRRPELVNGTCR